MKAAALPTARARAAGLPAGCGRERLLAAAVERFCEDGYAAVSVEDIAAAAGVSRMTFYRHFAGKAALAVELYARETQGAMPRIAAIAGDAFHDRAVVRRWMADLFTADQASRVLLRVFLQASVDDPLFAEAGHRSIAAIIVELGRGIPAFALDPDDPAQRRRWLEAWLLIYELLDQSNHAALHSGVATDPLMLDILADRFTAFIGRRSPIASHLQTNKTGTL